MGMKDFERAMAIIKEHSSLALFQGAKEEMLIKKAEEFLGLTFPPTYRRFLRELGCGCFDGEEFHGIVDEEFENAQIPDGVGMTQRFRKEANLPDSYFILYLTGDGFLYVLDTKQRNEENESPVLAWYSGISKPGDKLEVIAPDFGTFFYRTLKQALEDLS